MFTVCTYIVNGLLWLIFKNNRIMREIHFRCFFLLFIVYQPKQAALWPYKTELWRVALVVSHIVSRFLFHVYLLKIAKMKFKTNIQTKLSFRMQCAFLWSSTAINCILKRNGVSPFDAAKLTINLFKVIVIKKKYITQLWYLKRFVQHSCDSMFLFYLCTIIEITDMLMNMYNRFSDDSKSKESIVI